MSRECVFEYRTSCGKREAALRGQELKGFLQKRSIKRGRAYECGTGVEERLLDIGLWRKGFWISDWGRKASGYRTGAYV